MGWLLLGKQKHKRKPARKAATKEYNAKSAQWNPQRTLMAIKVLGAIVAVAIVVSGWNLGHKLLRKYIQRTYSTSVVSSEITLVNPPGWMSPGIQNNIKQTAAAHIAPDPLNSRSLQQAVTALSNIPWVKQVKQLQRSSKGQINLWASYRKPAALVKYNSGFYLVSAQGVELLPKPYTQSQIKKLGLPVVVGVSSAPPPAGGRRWDDSSLRDALGLINILEDRVFFQQIKAIDVSRHDARGRQRLTIHTVDGGQIVWGYAPSVKQKIEPATSVKIARLQRLAQVYNGSIDAGAQRVQIYGATIQTEEILLRRLNVSNNLERN